MSTSISKKIELIRKHREQIIPKLGVKISCMISSALRRRNQFIWVIGSTHFSSTELMFRFGFRMNKLSIWLLSSVITDKFDPIDEGIIKVPFRELLRAHLLKGDRSSERKSLACERQTNNGYKRVDTTLHLNSRVIWQQMEVFYNIYSSKQWP